MSKIKSLIRKNAKPANTNNPILDNVAKSDASINMTANTPIEQTRWNGWGNVNINKKVSSHGAKLIKSHIGKTKKLNSVSLQEVLKTVPKSRLPAAMTKLDTVSIDNEVRLRHARGQSFPDWIAMHGGDFEVFPDGVAHPQSTADVETLLKLAHDHDLIVIPFGGGTSVVGHINPQKGSRPVLTIAMSKMDQLIDLDNESQIATFGAGTQGPAVEAQLDAHGYRLGHYPQSWELSTLGGWIAARSSGQQSLGYGRIEQMFAGGTLVTPKGVITIADIPASSAGPDLREMMMGTEGRAGIFTEVKMRVQPQPEEEVFKVVFLPNWEAGKEVLRQAVQSNIRLSMLRLSNAVETDAHLHLGTTPSQFLAISTYLKARGLSSEKVMLTYGVSGDKAQNKLALTQFKKLLKQQGSVTGKLTDVMGSIWAHGRFKFPYLRGTLWEKGIMVDTFETATNWNNIDEQVQQMQQAVQTALADENEHVMAFTHISHVYKQGASLYTTYFFRAAKDHASTLSRWQKIKHAASLSLANGKSTISHQHGVGRDHAPYLAAEKGQLGIQVTSDMLKSLDPEQRMNPGVLIED
ncbi:FAD-binding oxidoreductase [Psychrobacter sp. AOP22-C1-22]|uniref:FAD-binding oxidoreductase n=1 Tax=unclassified Psychrobacter TaxID=196806 RepID=UPI001788980E|nr:MULTISPECIES: FAD-binding oxidoreductase [unclassified Psychrobacter]MDN5801463.1 FAD-binding oxidoreductase [Psychrobacter sp.]MBE0405696.1 FAD-binding oxidoreductase [Psychrobacter sp. FME6]MBE0445473.1 FAD-binding oxidoreductase [Psychrobacter sp. FME5]MDN5890711.1 FAD-binding oxidoreductase [Psychrobacter sp.]MDN5898202.1 FAD-binding oxidoreductase [Psychrobacter sp.]